jgi:hypothetical protein
VPLVEDNEDWIQHVQELEEVESMGFPLVADDTGEISRMVSDTTTRVLLQCMPFFWCLYVVCAAWRHRSGGARG